MENKIIEKEEINISENITQAAKKKLNKKTIAFVGIAVIIVLIVIAIICSVANKPIYKSEEEMYATFNGIWVSSENEYNDRRIIIDNDSVTSMRFATISTFEDLVNENGIEFLKQVQYRDCVSEIREDCLNDSNNVEFDIKKGVIKDYTQDAIMQLTENGTLEISYYDDKSKEPSSTDKYIKIAEDTSLDSFLNDYFEKDFYSSKNSKIEYYSNPEHYFLNPKNIYKKVKPFFAKYGYDIDNWNVTVDDGNIFSAETSSEAIVLQDSSLMINLAKGSDITRGLQVFATGNSANNIQLWFDGNDKDKAYELLDVIFDGAYVDDKTLSEYIEGEYKSHLNEGNVSNWSNGRIKYSVQFNNDLTFISLYRN